jgi:hypothetical protein
LIKTAKGVESALTAPMRLPETGGHHSVEVAGGSGPCGSFRAAGCPRQQGSNPAWRERRAQRNLSNVVRAIDKLGDWIGQTATFDLPGTARDGDGFIVLAQKGTPERPGAIIGAAKTEGL